MDYKDIVFDSFSALSHKQTCFVSLLLSLANILLYCLIILIWVLYSGHSPSPQVQGPRVPSGEDGKTGDEGHNGEKGEPITYNWDIGKTRGSRKKIHQILKGMEVERGPEGPPGSHMTAYLLLQNIQVNYPIVYFSWLYLFHNIGYQVSSDNSLSNYENVMLKKFRNLPKIDLWIASIHHQWCWIQFHYKKNSAKLS